MHSIVIAIIQGIQIVPSNIRVAKIEIGVSKKLSIGNMALERRSRVPVEESLGILAPRDSEG